MPTIKFTNEKKEVQVPMGANLRIEAIRAGVQVYIGPERVFNCHGFGLCGACRVNIVKGMENVSSRGVVERFTTSHSMAYIGNEQTMRLACQTEVRGDIEVQTCPPLNLYGENFFS